MGGSTLKELPPPQHLMENGNPSPVATMLLESHEDGSRVNHRDQLNKATRNYLKHIVKPKRGSAAEDKRRRARLDLLGDEVAGAVLAYKLHNTWSAAAGGRKIAAKQFKAIADAMMEVRKCVQLPEIENCWIRYDWLSTLERTFFSEYLGPLTKALGNAAIDCRVAALILDPGHNGPSRTQPDALVAFVHDLRRAYRRATGKARAGAAKDGPFVKFVNSIYENELGSFDLSVSISEKQIRTALKKKRPDFQDFPSLSSDQRTKYLAHLITIAQRKGARNPGENRPYPAAS